MSELRVATTQEVYMLCGLPGSGKTRYAEELMDSGSFVKFSIDEAVHERHGVYNVDYPHEMYRDLETATYQELDRELVATLQRGYSAILDYGFWLREQRDKYRHMLGEVGLAGHLLYFKASRQTLRDRLTQRNQQSGPNALHVDDDLFERMFLRFEAPEGEGEEIIPQD